ncbi:MAG TPA: glycoside hydrolase family 3 C-terminal domain-containing protein [Cellulomonas sp.]
MSTPTSPFLHAVAAVAAGAPAHTQAAHLYDALTDDERLDLLDGDTPFWQGMYSFVTDGYNVEPYVMGAVPRLGIPGIRFVDGPRGCVVGQATAFPVSMARGATWDVELEERIGEAIGAELRALGGNFFGGVCINLPRHPAWGRAQETYSDQPALLGEMGAALTRGIQRHAMACVKHFALNSMENARFSVDVTIDDATLHEDFLPHFRRVIDQGVAAVMSSYNSVNGTWAGQNPELLSTVLRDEWGFEGTVITDFIWGMRDGVAALRAGQDVEAPFRQQRDAHLRAALDDGTADWADVRRAGHRILATQLRSYAERDAEEPTADVVVSPAHTALARDAARRAMVLLRNEPVAGSPVLPLDPATLGSLAVVGRLADGATTGDHGSSDVRAPRVVSALDGLTEALPGVDVRHDAGTDPTAAARTAAGADVAVVVVGFTAEDEGEFVDGSLATRGELALLYPEPENAEQTAWQDHVMTAMGSGLSVVGAEAAGGDRRDLHLRASDVALVRAVAAANPRTVVVVVTAGAVLMEEWHDQVPGLLISWYCGMEGGRALADVLTGAHSPSGRLPYAIPADAADLPELDIDATAITYDRWFGQRLLAHRGIEALYPLGAGLSYTTWTIDALAVTAVDPVAQRLRGTATVTNTGSRDGRHVVQVYGTRTDGDRAGERELLGFTCVQVPAGGTVTAALDVPLTALSRWDAGTAGQTLPAGGVLVEAAARWGDPDAATATIAL